MDIDKEFLAILESGWDLKDIIKNRLDAPNLAVAIHRRFKKLYTMKIGETASITGFLVKRSNKYYIEMPPKELLNYYENYDQSLSYLVEFETAPIPPVRTVAVFKGTLKARHKKQPKIKRYQQVEGEYYLAIDDWKPDYSDLYIESPIPLSKVKSMVQEKINIETSLELPLIFSPISSPPLLNSMGGVSSLLSGVGVKHQDLIQIGKFIQNLVPPWHKKQSKTGFHIPFCPYLTQEVSIEIKNRKNYNLEYSPIVTHTGMVDFERESGFFYLDDPIVLYNNTFAFNESNTEVEDHLPDVQWSFMWGHLQLQDLTIQDFPTDFHNHYRDWISQMCEEFEFFKNLEMRDFGSLYSIKGRQGMIMRIAAAMSRINETPITKEVISKTFRIARDLYADFENAHEFRFQEYQEFRRDEQDKIRPFLERIFDLLLSYDEISLEQILQQAEEIDLSQEKAREFIEEFVRKGPIFESDHNKYRITPKSRK